MKWDQRRYYAFIPLCDVAMCAFYSPLHSTVTLFVKNECKLNEAMTWASERQCNSSCMRRFRARKMKKIKNIAIANETTDCRKEFARSDISWLLVGRKRSVGELVRHPSEAVYPLVDCWSLGSDHEMSWLMVSLLCENDLANTFLRWKFHRTSASGNRKRLLTQHPQQPHQCRVSLLETTVIWELRIYFS